MSLPIISRQRIVQPKFSLDQDDDLNKAGAIIERISSDTGNVVFDFNPQDGFDIHDGSLNTTARQEIKKQIGILLERVLACYPELKQGGVSQDNFVSYGLEFPGKGFAVSDDYSPTSAWHIDAGNPMFLRWGAMQNRTEVLEGEMDIFSYLPEGLKNVIAYFLSAEGGYDAENFLIEALQNPNNFGLGTVFYSHLNDAISAAIDETSDPKIIPSESGQLFVFDHKCVHRKGPLVAGVEGFSHTINL